MSEEHIFCKQPSYRFQASFYINFKVNETIISKIFTLELEKRFFTANKNLISRYRECGGITWTWTFGLSCLR